MICRFVILDGADGAPNFGDSRGAGDLGSRRCIGALKGFLIGEDPLEGPETLAGRWSG